MLDGPSVMSQALSLYPDLFCLEAVVEVVAGLVEGDTIRESTRFLGLLQASLDLVTPSLPSYHVQGGDDARGIGLPCGLVIWSKGSSSIRFGLTLDWVIFAFKAVLGFSKTSRISSISRL